MSAFVIDQATMTRALRGNRDCGRFGRGRHGDRANDRRCLHQLHDNLLRERQLPHLQYHLLLSGANGRPGASQASCGAVAISSYFGPWQTN